METLISDLEALTKPSSEFIEKVVSDLKEQQKGERPKSLKQSSLDCILKNMEKFLVNCTDVFSNKYPYNPLENLPNSIIQDFLDRILENMTLFSKDASKFNFFSDFYELDESLYDPGNKFKLQYNFLLQVLSSPLLREFDFARFCGNLHQAGALVEDGIFRHLLLNCPRIQQLSISGTIWANYMVVPRAQPLDLIRVMSCKWPNLAYLRLYGYEIGCEKSDSILETISTYVPNIIGLEMDMSLKTLTIEGVQHMSRMKKLKSLGLNLQHISWQNQDVTVLVHAVGKAPALEYFNFLEDENSICAAFVDLYGMLYPEKIKLCVQKIWLNSDLSRKWPKSLTLEELNLKGNSGDANFTRILLSDNLNIKKLFIHDITPSNIYQLVEKFGPGLTHLAAYHIPETLDPLRVAASCPKIQYFVLDAHFSTASDFKVPPEQFQKCHHLKPKGGGIGEDTVGLELLKMYLLGSMWYLETLKLNSTAELEVALQVLDMHCPTCLDRVETILINFGNSFRAQLESVLPLKLALLLVERSPYLKKVEFKSISLRDENKVPNWFLGIFQSLGISLKDRHGHISLGNRELPSLGGFSRFEG